MQQYDTAFCYLDFFTEQKKTTKILSASEAYPGGGGDYLEPQFFGGREPPNLPGWNEKLR